MTKLRAYRLASILLAIKCAGHTVGGMLLESSVGPEGDAILAAMKSVRFDFMGGQASWYGFHMGFGLVVSLFLALSSVIAWQLDKADSREALALGAPIGWAVLALNAINAILSWMYFFPGASVLATVATGLLALGIWEKRFVMAGRDENKVRAE